MLLWSWWLALHALLGGAALLPAWPWQIRLIAALVVTCHGVARRPRPPPRLILVSADAHCAVPGWQPEWFSLGARTTVCPYWIRLDLGTGLTRRDLLLCVDQLSAEEWARLRASLERARAQ